MDKRGLISDGSTERSMLMSKRELIDCIREINRSAKSKFLVQFSEKELTDYLENLMSLDLEELDNL